MEPYSMFGEQEVALSVWGFLLQLAGEAPGDSKVPASLRWPCELEVVPIGTAITVHWHTFVPPQGWYQAPRPHGQLCSSLGPR